MYVNVFDKNSIFLSFMLKMLLFFMKPTYIQALIKKKKLLKLEWILEKKNVFECRGSVLYFDLFHALL